MNQTVTPPTATSDPSVPPTEQPPKVPRKIRGTLTVLQDDNYEFHAQQATGIPAHEVLSSGGDSKLYKTTGEKAQKMVAHLVTRADSPDPVCDMMDQLEKLGKKIGIKPPPPKLKGRILLQQEDLRIVHNKKTGKVEVIIQLDTAQQTSVTNQLINKLQTISQCLAINKTSLTKPKS